MFKGKTLLICQDGASLIGGICGLKKTLFQTKRVSCDVPFYPADDPEKAVQTLTKGLSELLQCLGLQQLLQQDAEKFLPVQSNLPESLQEVRISLSANTALFRNWTFPFTSRSRAEQALNLLLETQFPCDPSSLIHQCCFTGRSGKGLQVISVSLPKAISEMWQKSCTQLSLPLSLLTINPFPILSLFPKSQDSFILLQKQQDHQIVLAMDKGVLRSVRIVEDDTLLSETLDLAQQDLTEKAKYRQISASDTVTLSALGRLSSFFPKNIYPTFPLTKISGQNKTAKPSSFGKRTKYISAIAFSCAILSCLFCLWAEGTSLFHQAEAVDIATAQLFKKIIPNGTVKNPVQMKSILKARCADLQSAPSGTVRSQIVLLLSEIHRNIPQNLQVRFEALTLDDTHCHLSGIATDYESVNALRLALSGIQSIKSATLLNASGQSGNLPNNAAKQGNQIRFEIDIIRN